MANTSALLSEVAVASMAAGLLDDFSLSNLDERSPIARFMAREFGYVRDEVLQVYPWHPALKRAALDPLTDAPAFGWAYAYELPADCLRLEPLTEFGVLNGSLIPHEVENGQVLTNQPGPLYIRYVHRLTAMQKWRPLMARTFAARLAMYAATRVTGKEGYYKKAREEYQASLTEAMHADTLERGTPQSYGIYSGAGQDVFSVRGLTP